MNRCTRCIMPESKPDILFDEAGVCSACRAYESRAEVDWTDRKRELMTILDRYRNPSGYDCIVPVSGGKDSTYQVLTLLELGANPLAVTATTDEFSDIGKRNLDNLVALGVDHVQVTTNPKVRRRINKLALERVGDISWPEHVTIFTVPVRLAVQLRIPLIVWGENPQHEYGGPAAAQDNPHLTRSWLEEFGGLNSLRVSDLYSLGYTERDLIQYTYPTDVELAEAGVTGIFLGHYVPWDGWHNAILAQASGFETYHHHVEGSLADYENLDNHQTGIHDYFKHLKYGFGRATDIACNHIRRGRLTRDEALKAIDGIDGAFPYTCLGKPIEETLANIGMTPEEFGAACERFTNRRVHE